MRRCEGFTSRWPSCREVVLLYAAAMLGVLLLMTFVKR